MKTFFSRARAKKKLQAFKTTRIYEVSKSIVSKLMSSPSVKRLLAIMREGEPVIWFSKRLTSKSVIEERSGFEGSPKKGSEEKYYPYNVGLFAPGTSTMYSILVAGKIPIDERTRPPILFIQNLLLGHRAIILSVSGYEYEKSHQFVLNLRCDMRRAEVTPTNVLEELKRLQYIESISMLCMKDKFYDELLFPLTTMDTTRLVSIKSDMTFLIEDRLKTPEEKSILFEAGRAYSLDVIERLEKNLPVRREDEEKRSAKVWENIAAYLKTTGWGSFSYEALSSHGKSDKILVKDPPVSKSGDASGNSFLHGIAAGMVQMLEKRRSCVLEDSYDKSTRTLSLVMAQESVNAGTHALRRMDTVPQETFGNDNKGELILIELEESDSGRSLFEPESPWAQ